MTCGCHSTFVVVNVLAMLFVANTLGLDVDDPGVKISGSPTLLILMLGFLFACAYQICS